MTSNWRRIFSEVWQRKKDWLLAIIGLALSIPVIEGPYWQLAIVIWLITLIWAIHIIRSGIREVISEEQEKPVPLMVIVGRDEQGYRTMSRQVEHTMASSRYNLGDYKSNWDIHQRDIELYLTEHLPFDSPPAWQSLVQDFHKRVVYLDHKLPNRTVFHLFLNCPAVLAFGLGARLDILHEVVLYHYQLGVANSPYIPVLDLSLSTMSEFSTRGLRVIKQKATEPYKLISVRKPSSDILKGSEVLVKLYLAVYDPATYAEEMAAENNWPLVHIDKIKPELPTERGTWLRATQEVSTVLRQLAASVKRIHLLCSIPVPLAFGIGMAMGTQSPITLYQWNSANSTYHPVLNLETLREQHAS